MPKRRERRRGARGATVVAIAVVAATAMTAAAFAVVFERTAGRPVLPHHKGSVLVKCRQGEQARAGGFSGKFDPTGSAVQLYTFSSRQLSGHYWRIRAFNKGGGVGRLVAHVYCDKRNLHLGFPRSKRTTIAPADVGSATAKCTLGSEALSGGFSGEFDRSGPGPVIVAFSSKRVDTRRWRVKADNEGTVAGRLTAYVYCGKKNRRIIARSKSATVQPGLKKSAKARCRPPTFVVGGGFTAPVVAAGEEPFPFVSQRVDFRHWKTSEFGYGSAASTFKTYAYCSR